MPQPNKPHGPHGPPPPHERYTIDIATRLTVAAIEAGFFANSQKPEVIIDFFNLVKKGIIDTPIDGDVD